MKPLAEGVRITTMIQRRTLLLSAPFAFLAACSRAEAVPTADTDAGIASSAALTDLLPREGEAVWFGFKGSVRTSDFARDLKPASLTRALVRVAAAGAVRATTHVFDLLQIEGQAVRVGPSVTTHLRFVEEGAGGLWMEREVTHPGLPKGVESARLAASGARVMLLSGAQIFLLEGGRRQAPELSTALAAQFTDWLAGLKT